MRLITNKRHSPVDISLGREEQDCTEKLIMLLRGNSELLTRISNHNEVVKQLKAANRHLSGEISEVIEERRILQKEVATLREKEEGL
jgi:predicted nuclease with TOPRIM domain